MVHGVVNTFYCKFMFIIGLKMIALQRGRETYTFHWTVCTWPDFIVCLV